MGHSLSLCPHYAGELSELSCFVRVCLSLQRVFSYTQAAVLVSMSRKAFPGRCNPPHQHNWQITLCTSQVTGRIIRPKILHMLVVFFLREDASAEQKR